MSKPVLQGPAPEIVMDNNSSPKADETPEASRDAPFTGFIKALFGHSVKKEKCDERRSPDD